MTDWRTSLAILAVSALTGLTAPPAPAQTDGTEPDAAAPSVAPQSPEEEAAQRQERLDALFAELATADATSWERPQGEIWALWSRSGSDSMDLLLLLASGAMEAQQFELALRYLNDLVRLAPGFAEGWNKRATVYFLLGEYGNSVADIEHTLALEPRHFGALSGLGMILERLGDKPGAMRAYRRGLEVHPHLPGAVEAVKRLTADVDGREL